MNAVIIGYGLIGKTLTPRVKQLPGVVVQHIVNKDALLDAQGNQLYAFDTLPELSTLIPDGVDIVFLAIAAGDNGESAYHYIDYCAKKGIPVVTCEKGALSYHYADLEPHLSRIGYSASVGGGTRLLPYLKERLAGRKDIVVHSVINGTLNYIFDEMARAGKPYGEVVDEAKRLGYTEPGAADHLAVLQGEIKDTLMKATILFNVCMKQKETMRPGDVTIKPLEAQDLSKLINEGLHRRYIVSFVPAGSENTDDVIGGFRHTLDGWDIVAGFQRVDANPLFRDWLPRGVNNAILTYEGQFGEDGIYSLSGPGAGPKPTTSSMIRDAKLLLGI